MAFFLACASLCSGTHATDPQKMLTLKEIRRRLQDRRPGVVAAATGLTAITIARIRDGAYDDPKLSTIEALSAYFEAQQ